MKSIRDGKPKEHLAASLHAQSPTGNNAPVMISAAFVPSIHRRVTVVTLHRSSPLQCRYLVMNWRNSCGPAMPAWAACA